MSKRKPKLEPEVEAILELLSGMEPEERLASTVEAFRIGELDRIPALTSDTIPKYIAAVNHAMLQGALSPQVGKIMLYGTQLFMAAAPAPAVEQIENYGVTTVHRSKPDRRFSSKEHTIDATPGSNKLTAGAAETEV